MLIGSVAVAAPATLSQTGLRPILAAAGPAEPPARPAWRTARPAATQVPEVAAVPADPAVALLNPPLPAGPPPAPAVPVSEIVAGASAPDDDDHEPADDGDEGSAERSSRVAAATVHDRTTERFVAGVLELTNEERRDAGCGNLVSDARLAQSAQDHAVDMAENDYFAHESEDGTRFDTRIRQQGYAKPGGENIAWGQTSAEQVVREWMASPPHRRNIENCAFTTIGVGYDDKYWVQDFGR
ncbi:hypothetical protein BJF78_24440 [Pseudonocardia sp. CNS-139]|nr:hypothetical protein BJF78_24440 [Pseudonocardia sp. CNS-139]